MPKHNRVFITGAGVVCPAGLTRTEAFRNMRNALPCINNVTRFDNELHTSKVGAEINLINIDERIKNRYVKFGQIAVEEALKDSNISNTTDVSAVFGTAIGATELLENYYRAGIKPRYADFKFDGLTNEVARSLRTTRQCYTVSTGCTAGIDAVGIGYDLVKNNRSDRTICGGSDAPISPIVYAAFDRIGALSKNANPQHASRPFTSERDGFVLGEGAGALVLESEKCVLSKPVHPIAEILGWYSHSSGFHMTSIRQTGEDIAIAISKAISRSGVNLSDIDLIDVHGTSTKQNDTAEYNAINKIFGIDHPPIMAQKSINGHALGAASAIELANLMSVMQNKKLFPIVNYNRKKEEIKLNTSDIHSKYSVKYALKIASGFSGIHTVMILKNCKT